MHLLRRLQAMLATRTRQLAGRERSRRGPLHDWTDAELYRVWTASAAELLRALDAEQIGTATEARRHLLTEIERRYPQETAAWLTSDAILTNEPPRFLLPDH